MGFYESILAMLLGHFLSEYLETNHCGVVPGADGQIRILPTKMRVPDLAFISWTAFQMGNCLRIASAKSLRIWPSKFSRKKATPSRRWSRSSTNISRPVSAWRVDIHLVPVPPASTRPVSRSQRSTAAATSKAGTCCRDSSCDWVNSSNVPTANNSRAAREEGETKRAQGQLAFHLLFPLPFLTIFELFVQFVVPFLPVCERLPGRESNWHGINTFRRFGPSPNPSPQRCRIQVTSLSKRLCRQRCGEGGTHRHLKNVYSVCNPTPAKAIIRSWLTSLGENGPVPDRNPHNEKPHTHTRVHACPDHPRSGRLGATHPRH